MFEQVEEARAGRGGKVLSEKEISKVIVVLVTISGKDMIRNGNFSFL